MTEQEAKSKLNLWLDNAATASQNGSLLEEITREAIELNVVKPLVELLVIEILKEITTDRP